MTRAAAMIAVMAAGSRETRCRALKCLNMALALSAGARRADSRLLRVSSSGVGQGFFVGAGTPIPAPWYPLSARTGIAGHADRYRAGSTWSLAAVGSWVEPGSTGPVYTGNPAKIHHHLHVAPERLPQDLSTTGGGPCRGCAGPPGRCGSGSRPGRRSAPWTRAVAEGPREGPGPGRRSPPGPRSGYR